jgi:outer membrane protein TolC
LPRSYTARSLLGLSAFCTALLLVGCASYQPAPLDDGQPRISSLGRVTIDARAMPLPSLASHRFDPSDGLDMTEVAMLAVANNPDLRLARDDLGIARAQSFAAGLLPDPQLSIASDWPRPGPPGSTRAFNYGLAFDFMSIVQRADTMRSAAAEAAKTDLGLLWLEWQTAAQARQLFVKAVYQDKVAPLLMKQKDLAQRRYAGSEQAAAMHEQTADALTASLTALQDARKQWNDAQRQRVQTRHDLNALLGIAPDTPLVLVGDESPVPPDGASVDAALAVLPRRRPDLLALRAGYEAQEAKYRAAILGQFPSLSIGFTRQRDTSNVYTSGFQLALNLPIFNRNRGNIEIEKATRMRMRDEYQIRLDQARADVTRLLADTAILGRQVADARADQPGLDQAADAASRAFALHALTSSTYTDAQAVALARAIDLATLEETLDEQQIALGALLGDTLPASRTDNLAYTDDHAK